MCAIVRFCCCWFFGKIIRQGLGIKFVRSDSRSGSGSAAKHNGFATVYLTILQYFSNLVSNLPTRRQLCLKGQSVVFVCGHACHAACLEREGGCHLSQTGEEVWTCLLCHSAPAPLGSSDFFHHKVGACRLLVYITCMPSGSVPDPWHFGVDLDPDPRIHASD